MLDPANRCAISTTTTWRPRENFSFLFKFGNDDSPGNEAQNTNFVIKIDYYYYYAKLYTVTPSNMAAARTVEAICERCNVVNVCANVA
jgi:hypothetical protein